jgi:hypothetical protein
MIYAPCCENTLHLRSKACAIVQNVPDIPFGIFLCSCSKSKRLFATDNQSAPHSSLQALWRSKNPVAGHDRATPAMDRAYNLK